MRRYWSKLALAATLFSTTTADADDGWAEVHSWQATFAAGYELFQPISRTGDDANQVFSMIVKNVAHEFRVCDLTKHGKKNMVGICSDVLWLDDLPEDKG